MCFNKDYQKLRLLIGSAVVIDLKKKMVHLGNLNALKKNLNCQSLQNSTFFMNGINTISGNKKKLLEFPPII